MDNSVKISGSELLNPGYILKEVLGLPSGSTVADLGCGSMGFFTLEAAKLAGDKGQVFACDILKEVLSSVEGKARQAGLTNIKTIWTNLEIVGAAKIDRQVDYVILKNTLFQAKKQAEVLAEAFRLLKNGGQLLFIEWQASSGPIGPAQELRVPQEKAEQLAQAAGFIKVKDFIAGNSHYGIIFAKP
ncbi:MAG: methyltransferase domain-containing protein [Candidatus Komeilibacteria bacterium]|nr:methyltransferase domain-containing protein [Candidatus Komeilibacteria bacterium]